MQTKKFNVLLLQAVLAQVLPMLVVGDEVISLASFEHAIAQEDGSLELNFVSGRKIVLDPKQAAVVAKNLEIGLERVRQMQANQAARELGIVMPMGQH